MNDATKGLYRKFDVRRTDGQSGPGCKHEDCRYFVIDLDHDPHARAAIAAYAASCEADRPALAGDLRRLVNGPPGGRATTGEPAPGDALAATPGDDDRRERAFAEGYAANRKGDEADDVPHPAGTVEHDGWIGGWHAAENGGE